MVSHAVVNLTNTEWMLFLYLLRGGRTVEQASLLFQLISVVGSYFYDNALVFFLYQRFSAVCIN